MVAVDAFGRHGTTRDLAQRGVSRSGRESVMEMGEFRRNVVGPAEREYEAMDFVMWVQCTNLYRVFTNLLITASSVTDITLE